MKSTLAFTTAILALAAAHPGHAQDTAKANPQSPVFEVVSSRPDMVSDGSALVALRLPSGIRQQDVRVLAGGKDITAAFKPANGRLVGLVADLPLGETIVSAKAKGRSLGTVVLSNHDRNGPIISGPHQAPFVCETNSFKLPDGTTLGYPEDVECNAPTKLTFVYLPNGETKFKPLESTEQLPVDVSSTTTSDGRTVPFVVRVETGTINRAIYQTAVLFDPTSETGPDPWKAEKGWNRKIVFVFGGGASSGYRQGSFLGLESGILERNMLSRGFAVLGSTLNVNAIRANDVVQAETASMVKERFIETWGAPIYTMGWGLSGGSMQQHLIANNYPGILDGITPENSFPDLHSMVPPTLDCALLDKAMVASKSEWTAEQKTAALGYNTSETCRQWRAVYAPMWAQAMQSRNKVFRVTGDFLADTNNCSFIVSRSLTYDRGRKPKGARCDIYSSIRNQIGIDPATGYALRAFDNVGVMYGLKAMQAGTISPEQFVQLNELAGGFDTDGNYQPGRTEADRQALENLYRFGRINDASNLGSIPVYDYRADSGDKANLHDAARSVVMRARMVRANGNADNHVIVRYPNYEYMSPEWHHMEDETLHTMDAWLSAIASDKRSYPDAHAKVVANRPSGMVDVCYSSDGERIEEVADAANGGRCGQVMPYASDPRMIAGAPLTDDVLKCQLKPLVAADYPKLDAKQVARLKVVFPTGVCDFTRPGVGFQALQSGWLSYPEPGVASPLGGA
ncbi:DUF6351 family protein [Novosphingobium malaysiense]|uniref:DUF6351 family protein n=1 Tax=Novosphingobium malaysiense TaxID=1348853 RepID=UPI000689FDAB|nr:DUF6351 family protein [Novosphingobium malaysiense]